MLKPGMIIIWPEGIGAIPPGFVICDGNNGTPNLQNRFVIGAGGSFAVGDTGGGLNHDHSFTTDGHKHDLIGGADLSGAGPTDDETQFSGESGTSDPTSSLPPFHALFYIMKT